MHPEVTKKDVKDFSQRYRHSAEEEEDLLDYFVDHDGDVTHMLESIICSMNEDVPRFVKFYEQKIKEGVLGDEQGLFKKTKGKIQLLPDEKAEAKKEKSKLKQKQAKAAKDAGVGSMADLEKMILAKRQTGFNGFLNYMTDKYAKNEDEDELMDDEEEEQKHTRSGRGKTGGTKKASTNAKSNNNK